MDLTYADLIDYRTADHPEANGRTPRPGEEEYVWTVTLDTGHTMTIRCGKETWETGRLNALLHLYDVTPEEPPHAPA